MNTDAVRSLPRALPITCLVLLGCEFEVTSLVSLPEVEGARSVVVGVEADDRIQVAALDLPPTQPVELPHLFADEGALMRVSARFFREDLATLEVPSGLIEAMGSTGVIPTKNGQVQQLRELQGDVDTNWRVARAGPRFEAFRSDALPPPSKCRAFEPLTVLPLEGTYRVRSAVAFGDGALIQQDPNLLFELRGTELVALHSTRPELLVQFPEGIEVLLPLAGGVLLAGCAAGAPRLSHLGFDGVLGDWPADGLPACAVELSAFGDQVFALVDGTEVWRYDAARRSWRSLAAFPKRVNVTARNTGFAFIALAPDRVLGISSSTVTPTRYAHEAMVLSGQSIDVEPLPVPDGIRYEVSRLARAEDRVAVVFGDAAAGAFFLIRAPSGNWRVEGPIESQIIYGLALWEEVLLATGRFGFILEARVLDPSKTELCRSEAVAAGYYATEIVPLRDGRFLIAGDVNFMLAWDDPLRRPQAVTLAVVR